MNKQHYVDLIVPHEMLEHPNWSPEGQAFLDKMLIDEAVKRVRAIDPTLVIDRVTVSIDGNPGATFSRNVVTAEMLATRDLITMALNSAGRFVRNQLQDGSLIQTPDGDPIYIQYGFTELREGSKTPTAVEVNVRRLQPQYVEDLEHHGWTKTDADSVTRTFEYGEWQKETYLKNRRYSLRSG